jgi:glutathione S-transferase
MIELYQFPFSHFCEKARWALDYKRVAYRPVNLLPGFHVRTMRRLAPETSVPALRDGKTIIQGSAEIIDYLDMKLPTPALTPRDDEAAREALEWERYFDEEIGVPARLCFYYHALPDSRRALGFLLRGAAWYKRPAFVLAFPRVRPAMMRFLNLTADNARQAEQRLRFALEGLDAALEGRDFLVGDQFSRADLTACALLSPLCLPDDEEAKARFPAAVLKLRDELKDRRCYRWVRGVYKEHRHLPQ